MTTLRVSVLVPTYNGVRFIRRTMQSILAQTYRAHEIIVVDDGPWDELRGVIAEFKDPRIAFHKNEKNLGMIKNWNRCISLARGDIIAFCHDDDYYEPGYLAAAVQAFANDPLVGVWACSSRFFDENERFIGTSVRPAIGVIAPQDYARQVFAMLNVSPPSETVLRKQAIDAVGGGYEESYTYAAEADLYVRVARAGFSAVHTADLLCNRTSWSNQSTARMMNSAANYRDRFTFLKRWMETDPSQYGGAWGAAAMRNQIKLAYWSIARHLSRGAIKDARDIADVVRRFAPDAAPTHPAVYPAIAGRVAVCAVARAIGAEPHQVTRAFKWLSP